MRYQMYGTGMKSAGILKEALRMLILPSDDSLRFMCYMVYQVCVSSDDSHGTCTCSFFWLGTRNHQPPKSHPKVYCSLWLQQARRPSYDSPSTLVPSHTVAQTAGVPAPQGVCRNSAIFRPGIPNIS